MGNSPISQNVTFGAKGEMKKEQGRLKNKKTEKGTAIAKGKEARVIGDGPDGIR